MWPVIINGFGIFYMLNVCVCVYVCVCVCVCVCVYVCVFSVMDVKHHPKWSNNLHKEGELITWTMIINGFGICYMLNVCVLSRYASQVVEIPIIISAMFMRLKKCITNKNK